MWDCEASTASSRAASARTRLRCSKRLLDRSSARLEGCISPGAPSSPLFILSYGRILSRRLRKDTLCARRAKVFPPVFLRGQSPGRSRSLGREFSPETPRKRRRDKKVARCFMSTRGDTAGRFFSGLSRITFCMIDNGIVEYGPKSCPARQISRQPTNFHERAECAADRPT